MTLVLYLSSLCISCKTELEFEYSGNSVPVQVYNRGGGK